MEAINPSQSGGPRSTGSVSRASDLPARKPERSGEINSSVSVELSREGLFASELVKQVKDMPATRPELTQEYKSQVKAGNYPPPTIVDGLAKLIGGSAASLREDQTS